MHLTVIDIHADVTGVGTGERAFLHLGLDTLEDGGHEAEVDGTTHDAVVEFQLAAPLEVGDILALEVEHGVLAVDLEVLRGFLAFDVRADEEVDLTELAGAAGLLLVTVLGGGHLGDGLAVRHLRSIELDVLLELVVHSPLDVVDVLLAHTGEDGLAEFLGVLDGDGRILGGDLVQGIAHLGLVVLVHGLDGAAVLRIREDHVLDGLLAGGGEGDVGLAGLELHDAADVTGADGGNLLLLGARDGVDGAEALAVAGFGVHEVGAFVEGAAHHLEVGHLTEVLLHGSLVDEDAHGTGRIANDVVAVDGLLDGAGGARAHIDDELHQAADSDVGLRGAAEHGDGLALDKAGADTLADLVGAEFHGLEELLHEFVGTLGGLLHEFSAEFLGLVGIGGGDVELLVLRVVVLHRDHIDKTLEARTRVHRELADDGLLAELLAEGVTDTFPVGLVVVQLVHGDDHGLVVLVRVAGEDGRSHLHAGGAVHHQDRTLDNLESGKGTAAEVIGTRRVDEVDLAAVELAVQGSGVDGLLVGLFELGVVGNRVLLLDTATAVDDLAFVKHGLGERSLTGAGGTDQDHVADFVSSVAFHCNDIGLLIFQRFPHLLRAVRKDNDFSGKSNKNGYLWVL